MKCFDAVKFHVKSIRLHIQWKPLNVITLGQMESDNFNRMITITDCLLIQKGCLLVIWDLLNQGQFDHINRMITLSVITLSGLHCNNAFWGFYLMIKATSWSILLNIFDIMKCWISIHDRNFELMKKLNFDLMKLDLLTPTQ